MRARAFFLGFLPIISFALNYEIEFVGMEQNAACLKAIQDASDLVLLQKRPPASLNGLHYRIASDVPEMLRVLRAFSYYDASIQTDLEKGDDDQTYKIYVFIESGPQFRLASYEVYNGDCKNLASIAHCRPISPEELGLKLGEVALSVSIVNGELNLLHELSKCGYPLAHIDKRRVVVDMSEQTVKAATCVQEGPLSKFGPSIFFGLERINPRFIESKIRWKEGEIYNSEQVEETQERLLKTELFSSVYISHSEALNTQGELPMKLRFSEAKYQKVSLGAFYGTVDGPGFSVSWSHRNIGGMSDVLTARADVSGALILGNMTYKKPDFLSFDQTYRAFGEISQENIKAYHAFIYRFANYIERKMNPATHFSVGTKVEHINVFASASNGTYLLLALPLFVRYDDADQFLDPTKGLSLSYSITPYQSLFSSSEHFIKQRITSTFYIPLGTPKLVFSLRAQLGSIAGAERKNIPLTKLFLGGSENELRGYRYKTVSPLNHHNKPLGGRSAIYATAELRWKMTKTIGIVPFLDLGTVTSFPFPNFTGKWRKSVGGGFRYFTFFGPLRLDIGFPLNKREIDHNFQVYGSVGQAF